MTDLVDAVRQLLAGSRHSPALIVQTPIGGYLVSTDGTGDSTANRFVISRHQLDDLMWEHRIHHDTLTDPQTAARLATLVGEFHHREHGS